MNSFNKLLIIMSWTVFILNILGNLSGKNVEIARHGSALGEKFQCFMGDDQLFIRLGGYLLNKQSHCGDFPTVINQYLMITI